MALITQIALVCALHSGALAADPKPIRIVALGDSLTAGFELPAEKAFPAVLERRLRGMGFAVEVANAGVSGDTTQGGLARFDWSIGEAADFVIVELGANDMLRAIAPEVARQNLTKIMERLKQRKIPAALAGMKSLANWGEAYRAQFEAIYPQLAMAFGTPLYPYFLEGVADNAKLTLPDELHPNAAGVEKIVDGFAPFLAAVLTAQFGGRALAK